jgi:hypothetical protein
LIALIPGQSTQALGLTLGTVGLIAWIVPLVFQIAAGRAKQYQTHRQYVQRVILHQAATIPFLLASLSLLGPTAGDVLAGLGHYFGAGRRSSECWVLLVEILR